MYLKICTKHKHKTTSVMEMGKHKHWLQLKPAVSTRATPTKGAEYLTAIQLHGKYVKKKIYILFSHVIANYIEQLHHSVT